jgi:hypothetical protein
VAADRIRRAGLDGQPEACRKAHSTQGPKVVLRQSLIRLPHRSQGPGGQVGPALNKVDDSVFALGERINEQGVDGEVTTLGIPLGIGELHRIRPASVGVHAVGPEGGDLDGGTELADQHHAERSADLRGALEPSPDVVGAGVGGDVVVLGILAEQLVADAAACQIGHETLLAESADDGHGRLAGFQVLALSARRSAHGGRVSPRRGPFRLWTGRPGYTVQMPDEPAPRRIAEAGLAVGSSPLRSRRSPFRTAHVGSPHP